MATPTDTLSDLLGEQAVRARLLQGAAKVFGDKGIEATTVELILQVSRVSRRTFYQCFRGKDDVLRALFEITTSRIDQAVEKAATSEDPVERLAQTVDAYLLLFQSGGRLALLLQTEAMRAGSALAPLRERTLDRLSKRSTHAFHARRGEAIDPLIFRGLFLALEGLLAHVYRDGEPSAAQLARVRRAIVAITTRTLGDVAKPLPTRSLKL